MIVKNLIFTKGLELDKPKIIIKKGEIKINYKPEGQLIIPFYSDNFYDRKVIKNAKVDDKNKTLTFTLNPEGGHL